MKRSKLKFLSTLLSLFVMTTLFSVNGFSADDGGYANIILGLSVPDSANTTQHTMHGIGGGAPVSANFSLGGYHTISTSENGPGNAPIYYTLTGLEGRTNLGKGAKYVFLGFRAGITKVTSSESGSEVTFSPYHYGVVSGYSFKLWGAMSVGFEGSFLAVSDSTATSAGVALSKKSFHLINFFGTIGLTF